MEIRYGMRRVLVAAVLLAACGTAAPTEGPSPPSQSAAASISPVARDYLLTALCYMQNSLKFIEIADWNAFRADVTARQDQPRPWRTRTPPSATRSRSSATATPLSENLPGPARRR